MFHKVHSDICVVSWQPFPDVVEQRSEHQQIGTLDTFCELCRVCCGFPQVSVNGEPVIGVALWLSSHWRPFWEYALNERVLIEAFQHWNRTMALEEKPRVRRRLLGATDQASLASRERTAGGCGDQFDGLIVRMLERLSARWSGHEPDRHHRRLQRHPRRC